MGTSNEPDAAMEELSEDDYVPKDSISLDPNENSNMQPIGRKKPRITGCPAAFSVPPAIMRGPAVYNDPLHPNGIPGLFGYSADDRNVSGMSYGLTTDSPSSTMINPSSRNTSGTPSYASSHYANSPADRRDSTRREVSGQSYSATSDRPLASASAARHGPARHDHSVSTCINTSSASSSNKRSATHYPPRPPSPHSAATRSQIAVAASDTRAALKKAEESFHILTSLSGMRRSDDVREIEYLKNEVEYHKRECERIRGLLHTRERDVVTMRARAEKAEARVRELESRDLELKRQARELLALSVPKTGKTGPGSGW